MNKHMVVIWLAGLLASMSVWAVKLNSLYQVSVPVATQAADARTEAIHTAFQDVLIRLTGDPDILSNKAVKASLNRADYYVQEFSYSTPDVSAATYMLNVKFSERDVKRLLKKAGAKEWKNIRPLVLVWLATVSDKNQVDIMGVESGSQVLEKFKQQGQRYGIPLIFPVMDVTDMTEISADNITSVALPEIKNASKRYQPDALLVGTMESHDEGYEARWNLVAKEKVWDFTTSGATQEQVIGEAMDHLTEMFTQNNLQPIKNNG